MQHWPQKRCVGKGPEKKQAPEALGSAPPPGESGGPGDGEGTEKSHSQAIRSIWCFFKSFNHRTEFMMGQSLITNRSMRHKLQSSLSLGQDQTPGPGFSGHPKPGPTRPSTGVPKPLSTNLPSRSAFIVTPCSTFPTAKAQRGALPLKEKILILCTCAWCAYSPLEK